MQNKTYTLGIDLHKYVSTWVLVDQNGTKLQTLKSVDVRPHDISTAIENLPRKAKEIQVALEPVGGWRWVVEILEESGMDVHVANPLKHRSISESDFKNDLNDAEELARLLRTGSFHHSYRASDEINDLRRFLRQRQFLVIQKTSAKLRLQGCATAIGLHYIPSGNPTTKEGMKFLEENGDILEKDSVDYINQLEKRVARFDKELNKFTKRFPETKYLMSMPGCGVLTALTVVAQAGDFSRFKSPHAFARYAGLIPSERSSGGKTKFGPLARSGDRILRNVLVEHAMRIRETNAPELHAFVVRLGVRMTKKKARTALAHKLLAIMWKLVTTQTEYNPSIIANTTHGTNFEQTR